MKFQKLVLVDKKDNFVGNASYEDCHRGKGVRHRAFVTLLFDKNNWVLLQRRKHRLFDGLWDLTAISHPLVNGVKTETYQQASDRALNKEMGIKGASITNIGAFNYFARDGKNCENEYCAVLVGNYDGRLNVNHREIYESKKVSFGDFIKELRSNKSNYTPWAIKAGPILQKYFKKRI